MQTFMIDTIVSEKAIALPRKTGMIFHGETDLIELVRHCVSYLLIKTHFLIVE